MATPHLNKNDFSTTREYQLEVLRAELAKQPEKKNGKWNKRHFALKGKIRVMEERVKKMSYINWLAQ